MLKERQRSRADTRFRRRESLQLVREHIACIGEITSLMESEEQKLGILQDLSTYWGWPRNTNLSGKQQSFVVDRIEWAKDIVHQNHRQLPRLLKDLRNSLDIVSRTPLLFLLADCSEVSTVVSTEHHRAKRTRSQSRHK